MDKRKVRDLLIVILALLFSYFYEPVFLWMLAVVFIVFHESKSKFKALPPAVDRSSGALDGAE